MGLIYQKTALDKVYIMGTQTVFQRPFQLGDWTDIIIGGFSSGTSAADPNATGVNQTLTDSVLSRCYMGLKDSSTALPFSTGSIYAGWTSYFGSGNPVIASAGSTRLFGGSSGSKVMISSGGDFNVSSGTFGGLRCRDGTASTEYAQPFALRLQLVDWGTGSQSITFTLTTDTDSAFEPYGVSELQAYLLSPTGTSQSGSVSAVVNGSMINRSDLSTFYIRWPFTLSRWRLSCIGMERLV